MTEHFTRAEAATLATQGDKAYKRGFSDGMKEAPTGESWIRAIDEAMVGAHIGVAEMADDYGTAKKKLNALICWSVQVDRDLSRTQAAPALKATIAQPEQASVAHTFGTKRRGPLEGWIGHHTPPANGQQVETLFCWGYENWAIHLGTAQYKELVRGRGGFYGAETGRPQDTPSYWRPLEGEEAPVVGVPDSCLWTPDTDYETDVHYSACGEAWSFIEGGPKENNVRFCQGCGKPVKLAAALLSAPALPVPSDSDDLIKALADVRDLFPIPERGSKLEHAWMEAVAFPESVPAYVRACIAPAAMPVGELTDEQILDKKRIEQCVAVFVNVATFGSNSKYEDGAPTPNRLLQLDCAKYLHGLVSTEDFESANKFLLGQFEAVPASPSTAGERDNKTEMLAKLTAWLDSLGGKLHTYSLRGIALAGFEEGWSAALMQSTADHIAQNRKLVAALPVGELPEPFHPSASHISPDYRDGWNAALAATQSAGVPVGELTLEQITRIYERYGGDMVNCTRAIERELAAASSQPVREPLGERQTPFANCRFQICDLPGQCRGEGKCHHPAVQAAHGITKKGGES